jgi:tRNA pseudouridine32 synthase/23S rRNA pseudouridine746 synthase
MEINPQTGVEKWILSPLTGRGHQLRFEMFRHDRPILGDVLYGADPRSEAGIALKAIALDFSLAKKALPEEFLSLGLSSTYKFDGQKFEILA